MAPQPVRENSILKRPMSVAHNDDGVSDDDDDDRAINPLMFIDKSNKDDLLQCSISSSSSFSGVKRDGSVVVPQPIKLDTSKLLKTVYKNDNPNPNPPRVFTSIYDTNGGNAPAYMSGVSKIGMVGLSNHSVVKNSKDLATIQSINNYKKENEKISNMFNRNAVNTGNGIRVMNTTNANEYQMIGNVLVNVNRLNANIVEQKTVHDKEASDRAKPAAEANKLKRKLEIEELLNRKSAHCEEASDEAFDSFSKKLKTLESREKKSDKENAVTFVHVKGVILIVCLCPVLISNLYIQHFPVTSAVSWRRKALSCAARRSTQSA